MHHLRLLGRSVLAAAITAPMLLMLAAPAPDSADDAAYFEKNVRPLLVARCMVCHTGAQQPMAGLALDSRDRILKGGGRGAAVIPGQPAASLLLKAVNGGVDGVPKMPPSGKLKDSEIATLAEWIQRGAPWGDAPAVSSAPAAAKFWAFVPPAPPSIPQVRNSGWVRSPIDAFVLAGLEAKSLTPAPPADKRTLIRRATYDLTGLPPTPGEVNAFLADNSPDAFKNVVERLLVSPRYGERWGRHWLDVARYADSNGLDENLVYRHAWRYRDYVIAAFNKDKPYDQFVREQLAGDLLPPSDPADLATRFERYTATGFLSLGAKMLAEDDPVKMEMDIIDEQLDTTARAFMGLTIGCARCHDHKFDPIPQADYYSLAGIFKSSKTMENFKVVAKWHEFVLAPDDQVKALRDHEAKIEAKRAEAGKINRAEYQKLVAVEREKTGAYLQAAYEVMRSGAAAKLEPATTPPLSVIEAAALTQGTAPKKLERGKNNVPKGHKGPLWAEYTVRAPAAGDYQIDLFELEAGGGTHDIRINGELVNKGLPPVQNREASPDAGGWTVQGIFPLRAGDNAIRLEHRSRFPYFEKLRVAPSSLPPGAAPKTTAQVARQFNVNLGLLEHWVEELERSKGAPHSVLFAWHEFGKSWDAWTSPAAKLFSGAGASRPELAARYQQSFNEALAQAAKLDKDKQKKLDDPALDALREFLFEKAGVYREPGDVRQYYSAEVQTTLVKLDDERKALEDATPDLPRAMGVTESGSADDLAIHLRGSHWTLGNKAPRGFLRAVGHETAEFKSAESGRLQLANWLTRPDHPLTSRVMANRLWRWHFGRGIVASTDNFGRLGEKPSNQALLDWLAVEFVKRGWSIKQMHRELMLSNTYQMSSAYNAPAAQADPENILLWRMPRRRLEAESIRDAIMASSGGLELSMGGTILEYKDRQYISNTSKRGGANYDLNRRAVYLPVVRSSMYEMFQAFDLPDPSSSSGDRQASVVAPQALFMMNGSVMLTHSRIFADRLLELDAPDDAARVRAAFERALSRPPTAAELDRALTFIDQMTRASADRAKDDKERRALAWQSFAKSLMSSNEFVYLN